MARLIARIGRAHGLRGEVTVQVHTDDPERRLAVGSVLDAVPAAQEPAVAGALPPTTLTVETTRVHRGIWLVGFEGVADRSAAEALRGSLLVVGDAADPDDEDAWYEEDLVGLHAVDADGAEIGVVTALELGAAQDLLVLRLPGGETATRTALVPFVSQIVPEVDVAGGRIVVDAPAGLLDLGAGE